MLPAGFGKSFEPDSPVIHRFPAAPRAIPRNCELAGPPKYVACSTPAPSPPVTATTPTLRATLTPDITGSVACNAPAVTGNVELTVVPATIALPASSSTSPATRSQSGDALFESPRKLDHSRPLPSARK